MFFLKKYSQMQELDPELVMHQVKIKERTRPVKQASRKFRLELEVLIKQNKKLLGVGCIKPI